MTEGITGTEPMDWNCASYKPSTTTYLSLPFASTAVDLQGPPLSVWAKGCAQDRGSQGPSGKFTHMPF